MCSYVTRCQQKYGPFPVIILKTVRGRIVVSRRYRLIKTRSLHHVTCFYPITTNCKVLAQDNYFTVYSSPNPISKLGIGSRARLETGALLANSYSNSEFYIATIYDYRRQVSYLPTSSSACHFPLSAP
jgi:hypothetical protein